MTMKITISPTSKIVICKPGQLETGVPARIWEGETESGMKVHCLIARVAVDKNEPRIKEFQKELMEVNAPSAAIEAYPTRLNI